MIDNRATGFLAANAEREVAIVSDAIGWRAAAICEISAKGQGAGYCVCIYRGGITGACGGLVASGIGDAGRIAEGLVIIQRAAIDIAPVGAGYRCVAR